MCWYLSPGNKSPITLQQITQLTTESNKLVLSRMDYEDQASQRGLAGWFWLRHSHQAAVKADRLEDSLPSSHKWLLAGEHHFLTL
jgi:hypothetical protein